MYPNSAYGSGEEPQTCPQKTGKVEPAVGSQQSSYDALLIPGLGCEPIQTDFYGGKTSGQYTTQYGAMKGMTSSWPYITLDNTASSNMPVALSVAGTELSSSSPESLLSDIADQDEPHEAKGYYPSSDISWSGSDTTLRTSFEYSPSCREPFNLHSYNLNQPKVGSADIGLTGLPYATSSQETPFLDPRQGYEIYPIQQQPNSSVVWSTSDWTYMDNLGARDPFPWGSAQETTYLSPQCSSDVSEQQGEAAHCFVETPTVHMPPPEHRIVSSNSSDRVSILKDDGLGNSRAPSTTHAQRKKEDQILLEGKRAGLTYKEIKKHMHSKVAESTLRGRYRSLTKARKDRVRKPVWNANDVRPEPSLGCPFQNVC